MQKKNILEGQRKLKVQPKYFSRAYSNVIFPEIRLAGKWLQDIGFVCGKKVVINHEKNKIVITVPDEE